MDSSTIYERRTYDRVRDRKKYSIRMNTDKSKRKKTSIVVSFQNRSKLLTLGKYRESYDDILMRLINFSIKKYGNLSVRK